MSAVIFSVSGSQMIQPDVVLSESEEYLAPPDLLAAGVGGRARPYRRWP